jgi:sepiapterin reductase
MKRLVVITGASRGIGSAIANESTKKFPTEDTIFLLIARDLNKLEQLRQEIGVNRAFAVQLDFSLSHKPDELKQLLTTKFLDLIRGTDVGSSFDELYIFYNHGTLIFGRVDELGEVAAREFQTNVVSVWELLSALRGLFSAVPKQFHVNMSSLLATKLEAQFSVYSTTRSARATLFKCLALEQPGVRVLNYQPGPVYTDMLKQIAEDEAVGFKDSPGFKGLILFFFVIQYDFVLEFGFFKLDEYKKGNLVQPEVTVKRLWAILDRDEFESGSVVDYFDVDF